MSKNSNHPCNCAKNFEKIYIELDTFKIIAFTQLDIIKNMVFTLHSMNMNYFNQQKEKDDNLEGKFDIQFATPNTTQTKSMPTKISKQPCNSPFMQIPSQDLGNLLMKMLREN